MSYSCDNEAIKYFLDAQASIFKAEHELKAMVAKYKAETKEYFGVEDGQPLNLLQLSNLIIKLVSKKPEPEPESVAKVIAPPSEAEVFVSEVMGAPV